MTAGNARQLFAVIEAILSLTCIQREKRVGLMLYDLEGSRKMCIMVDNKADIVGNKW